MCGLVGMVAADNAPPPSRTRLQLAVRALNHRGPDDAGFHLGSAVALGSTRLSIVDLELGAQPMRNEDGSVVVVYNGEIWNHESLRRELELVGHRFGTRADTEVLVHAYEQWGDEFVSRLHGMFAFALWDEHRERLVAGRDRLGKKPLYLARTPHGLAFGSDARAVILVAGMTPELDRDRLPQFLFQRYVNAPGTLFRGVEKLPPAHILVYDRRSTTRQRYWQLPAGPPESIHPGELRILLQHAVQERLMGDVPLGVLLSGGVDSSAVLSLANEVGAQGLSTFTVGFSDRLYDERPLARLAAQRFNTEHHELMVDARHFAEALPRLAWFRDEPIAEASEIPLLLLAEFAARHVKVVLTGDGGDELFGGYPKYRAERLLRAGGFVPKDALRIAVAMAARHRSHRQLERAAGTLAIKEQLVRWASWFRTFSPDELERLLLPPLRHHAAAESLCEPLREALAAYAGVDDGRRMLIGDLQTYLPDNMLARSDKVLMAASLEGRMPLLDQKLVERVNWVPASDRSGLRTPKGILRAAVADRVPEPIMRSPKRGFSVPVEQFVAEDPERPLEGLVLSERSLERGLFEPRELERLIRDRPRLGDRDRKLFLLASLELWLRANVDEVRLEPPEGLEDLLADPLRTAGV
jgi:asparagine synthase (glutamine-hydrolysing)